MEYKGSSFAFVAGLTAGIINMLLGFNVLLGTLIALTFVDIPGAVPIYRRCSRLLQSTSWVHASAETTGLRAV